MLIAYLAQATQELGWGRDVAALAKHGLNDNRRGVGRGCLLCKQQLELVQRVRGKYAAGRSDWEVGLVPVWVGDRVHARLDSSEVNRCKNRCGAHVPSVGVRRRSRSSCSS